MNDFYYSIVLFLHIVGALGFFMALGFEWTGLRQMQSAIYPEQVRSWMGILRSARNLGFASMLTTVISGFYMMATEWGAVAWIIVTLGSLVLVIATPQLVREAFFSADFPDEELRAYWKQMQNESYMALLDMVVLDRPDPAEVKTPLLVLGVTRDDMLTPGEIEATARAYNTQAEIIPDVAHDSMLEQRWQNVAKRILDWLKEWESWHAFPTVRSQSYDASRM